MLLGMAVTFAAVATLAAVGGGWAVQANEYGRYAAMALLAVFGLTLLFPALADRMTRPLVALGARLSQIGRQTGPAQRPLRASLLLGVATGLLWAPCAGPILGLILTGAAISGASVGTSLLLLAYAAGAATSLAAGAAVRRPRVRGDEALARHRRMDPARRRVPPCWSASAPSRWAWTPACSASCRTAPRRRSSRRWSTASTQRKPQPLGADAAPGAKTRARCAPRPRSSRSRRWHCDRRHAALAGRRDRMAQLAAADAPRACAARWCWSTSGPTPASTACARCPTSAPGPRSTRMRGWSWSACTRRSSPSRRIGQRAPGDVKDLGIGYPGGARQRLRHLARLQQPVLAGALLRRCAGPHPPSPFRRGPVREVRAGDPATARRGGAQRTCRAVWSRREAQGAQAAPDAEPALSGETYLGYERASNFAPPRAARIATDRRTATRPPHRCGLNQWALGGDWTVERERAVLGAAPAGASPTASRRATCTWCSGRGRRQAGALPRADRRPAAAADHGTDVDAQGKGTIDAHTALPAGSPIGATARTACSRSSSSTPAPRPMRSPSAEHIEH